MSRWIEGMLIGMMIGLLIGVSGIFIHNYEFNKCKSLISSTNQQYYNYELQENCYFVIEETGLHLLIIILVIGIPFIILFGLAGAFVGDMMGDTGW